MNFKLFTKVASITCMVTLIIGLGFTLTSCEKENTVVSPKGTRPIIYGKWQGTEFDINNNDEWADITRITLNKEDNRHYATYRIIELTHKQMEVVVNLNPGVFHFRMQRLRETKNTYM